MKLSVDLLVLLLLLQEGQSIYLDFIGSQPTQKVKSKVTIHRIAQQDENQVSKNFTSCPLWLKVTLEITSNQSIMLDIGRNDRVSVMAPVYWENSGVESRLQGKMDFQFGIYQDRLNKAELAVVNCDQRELLLEGFVHGDRKDYVVVPSKERRIELYERNIDRTFSDEINGATKSTAYSSKSTEESKVVELFLVIGYSVFEKFLQRVWSMSSKSELGRREEAIKEVKRYYAYLVNGMDSRYRSFSRFGLNVRIHLVGYHLALTPADALWEFSTVVDPESKRPSVNAIQALNLLSRKLENMKKTLKFDHAQAITANELYLNTNSIRKKVRGSAFQDSICSDKQSFSIIEDDFKLENLIQLGSHYLGHNLGMVHDGEANRCNANRFIMKPSDNHGNALTFSNCSAIALESTVASKGWCLSYLSSNPQSETKYPRGEFPGQESDVDQQCRTIYGEHSYYCSGPKNDGEICRRMTCFDPRQNLCSRRWQISALRGTSCGNKRLCILGQCAAHEQAPVMNQTCVFGNRKGFVYRNVQKTCIDYEVSKGAGRECMRSDHFRESCCQTCANVAQADSRCPFGDQQPWCRRSSCTKAANWGKCCESCDFLLRTFRPMPQRDETLLGYQRKAGDCLGARMMLPCESCKTVESCANHCNKVPACVGFSFAASQKHCAVRPDECSSIVRKMDWYFYAREASMTQKKGSAVQCEPSPCKNRGLCRVRGDSYICKCPRRFGGVHCEHIVHVYNPCSPSPCFNLGTCIEVPSVNGALYTCRCMTDYEGSRCEKAIKGQWSNIPSGYRMLYGKCESSGDDFLSVCESCKTISQCAESCDGSDECRGFAWVSLTRICVLKKLKCTDPVRSETTRFFEKETVGTLGCSKSTEEKSFVVVFMENKVESGSPYTNTSLQLHLVNVQDSRADVEIRIDRTVRYDAVYPNTSKTVAIDNQYRLTGSEKARKVIRIISNVQISLFAYNLETNSGDAFLVLPVSRLGQLYYPVTYGTDPSQALTTQIAIAATLDGTRIELSKVTIQDGCRIHVGTQIYRSRKKIVVNLQKDEVQQIQSNCNLTGIYVSSNKPVAVFSGNTISSIGPGAGESHLVEQSLPLNVWGDSYIITPTEDRRSGDWILITVLQNDTEVKVRGNVETYIYRKNEGESLGMNLPSNMPHHVKSNRPISIVQFVYSAPNDRRLKPTMFNVVPVSQFGMGYYVTIPNFSVRAMKHYLSLSITQGHQYGLRINSAPFNFRGSTWRTVGFTDYVVNYAIIDPGSYHISHMTRGVTFGLVQYGATDGMSYAFPAGMCMENRQCFPTFMIENDGNDNDCDNLIDEEVCGNFIDDDGDGRVDEDCHVSVDVKVQDGKECDISNVGNSFYICFLENLVDDPRPDMELEVFIAAKSENQIKPILVRLESSLEIKEVTINATEKVKRVTLSKEHRLHGSELSNKTIKISSSDNIVVYGVNKDTFSNDAFLALPVQAVGQHYFAVTFFPPTTKTQLGIAAIYDCGVTVTLPKGCSVAYKSKAYSEGQSISIQMRKMEAFQLQSTCDLTGTKIDSTHPVSVFSGNVRTSINGISRDHLVEQLNPVSGWGKNFVSVPIPKRTTGDFFVIVAAEGDTTGTIKSAFGDEQQFRMTFPGDSVKITFNRPIQVVQFVYSQTSPSEEADPAMILLAPNEQHGLGYTFVTPEGVATKYTNFVLLAIHRGNQDGLRLDGNRMQPAQGWQNVGDTMVTNYISITPGIHTLTHVSNKARFAAYIYGAGDRESFAYPTGTCVKVIKCTKTFMVPGDGRDNDCDSQIDEEVCGDGLDQDGDGAVDEDCVALPATRQPITRRTTTPTSTTTSTTVTRTTVTTHPITPTRPITQCQPSNEGKEFWVAFLENSVPTPNNAVHPKLLLTSSFQNSRPVAVQVISAIRNQSIVLYPFEVRVVEIPKTIRLAGNRVERKAIFITANDSIMVYGLNLENKSSDGFLALPTDALGTGYFAVSYYPGYTKSLVGVVSTMDNTQVDIKLPSHDFGPSCAVKFKGKIFGDQAQIKVTLNRFETFQIGDLCDLSATKITADKPVMAFSGNSRTNVGHGVTYDHLVAALTPVSTWGTKFTTIPSPKRTLGDLFIIVASENDTTVTYRDGNNLHQLKMNEGDRKSRELRGRAMNGVPHTIFSNRPIQVMSLVLSHQNEISDELAEPSMIGMVPQEQLWHTYHFTTPEPYARNNMYSNYLMISIRNGYWAGLRLDGQILNPDGEWQIESSDGRATNYIQIPNGRHKLAHIYQEPFAAYLYALSSKLENPDRLELSQGYPVGQCLVREGRPSTSATRTSSTFRTSAKPSTTTRGKQKEAQECSSQPCITLPTVRACFGFEMRMECPQGQQIKLIQAHFGRVGFPNEHTCGSANVIGCSNTETNCGFENVQDIISPRCEGKTSCSTVVTNGTFGTLVRSGPCQPCSKYLEATYMCAPRTDTCSNLASVYQGGKIMTYDASSYAATRVVGGGECLVTNSPTNRQEIGETKYECEPKFARFSSSNTQSWCSDSCDLKYAYLLLDLKNSYNVKGFIMQGRRRLNHYVTEFGISYSNDNKTWIDVEDSVTKNLVNFVGNEDAVAVKMCLLSSACQFVARYIRLFVLNFHSHPAWHVEVLRCSQAIECPAKTVANSNVRNLIKMPDQEISVECLPGFYNSNGLRRFSIKCLSNGQWNSSDTCLNNQECGPIPRVEHGWSNAVNLKIGASVAFECSDGYNLNGPEVIYCQSNGEWTQAPTCEIKTENFYAE